MRVLVFGGAGFLGCPLVETLSKTRSNTIQVMDTFTHGFITKPVKKANILSPISGSVRDYYAVIRAIERFSPDIVVHLAAFNSRPETMGDFRTCSEVNYVGTANVMQACLAMRKTIKRVVFASSLAAENPVSHYGISKRAAEDLLISTFTRFPPDTMQLVILRFAEIYGNSLSYTSTSLLNFFVDVMVKKDGVAIYGPKEQVDCVHISDAVRACDLAIKTPLDTNVLKVDVGTGQGITIKDLLQKAKEICNYEGPVRLLDSPLVPVQSLIADPLPAKQKLGFECSADLDKELVALIKARRKALRE